MLNVVRFSCMEMGMKCTNCVLKLLKICMFVHKIGVRIMML